MKNTGILPVVFAAPIVSMNNDSYWGIAVPSHCVEVFRNALARKMGQSFEEVEAAKERRDGVGVYHITVVNPKERRILAHDAMNSLPVNPSVELVGVGHARDGENEAWFVVCHSDDLNEWRETQGLNAKDFHVTLAFRNKDVHTQPKNDASIVLK